jgi:hypothetical protein
LRFRVVNRHLDGGWRMGNGEWGMENDGDGYRVTCQDGTVSLSGGKPGACSQHGGVR